MYNLILKVKSILEMVAYDSNRNTLNDYKGGNQIKTQMNTSLLFITIYKGHTIG